MLKEQKDDHSREVYRRICGEPDLVAVKPDTIMIVIITYVILQL